MSEHLHHHDERWDDMLLPGEEEAWQKMKLLLEKEDRRRRWLPFWFWRYGLLGLLVVGLATGSYFMVKRKDEKASATSPSAVKPVPQPEEREQRLTQLRSAKEKDKDLLPRRSISESQRAAPNRSDTGTEAATAEKKEGLAQRLLPPPVRDNKRGRSSAFQQTTASSGDRKTVQKKKAPWREDVPANDAAPEESRKDGLSDVKTDSIPDGQRLPVQLDGGKQGDTTKAVGDSIRANDSARVVAAPPMVSNEPKAIKAKKNNDLFFSAGVGLQQAIALNGQQSSSYNLNGNRNRLSDHIPSVYLRLQNKRWFLQAEFQYKVPQPVKPFSFSQTTTYSAFRAELRTEKSAVQKLYYHQVPVSINYFLLPAWSWGVGGTYNRLAGSVTEVETENRNVAGGGVITSNVVPVKGYRDSFFYKSTAGLLLQTDYHWKRLSVGLRYTGNLQPFIKYTQPDGTVIKEKNQVLQAVLRFRIN